MFIGKPEQRNGSHFELHSYDEFLTEILGREHSGADYARVIWLGHVGRRLRQARLDAGLSQQDVADRMGTSQSSVARMELDTQGRVTVRRMLDFLLACSKAPLFLGTIEIEEINRFATERPLTDWTAEEISAWRKSRRSGARSPATAISTLPLDAIGGKERRDFILELVSARSHRPIVDHLAKEQERKELVFENRDHELAWHRLEASRPISGSQLDVDQLVGEKWTRMSRSDAAAA